MEKLGVLTLRVLLVGALRSVAALRGGHAALLVGLQVPQVGGEGPLEEGPLAQTDGPVGGVLAGCGNNN